MNNQTKIKKFAQEVSEEPYEELQHLDWVEIPNFPYIMKYKFDEEGYIFMISDLAAVYGEKLDKKAIEERFQNQNPFVDMLPNVILKYVKKSVENTFTAEQSKVNIILDSIKVTIEYQFDSSGVRFVFNFEPQILSRDQFKTHVVSLILLRALNLEEEKEALERRVEQLEGRESSFSSRSSERRNIKITCSEIKNNPFGSGVIHGFLHLQKAKMILTENQKDLPSESPSKRFQVLKTGSSPNKIIGSRNTFKGIPFVEIDSKTSNESKSRMQRPEEPEKIIEKKITEDSVDMNGLDNSFDDFSTKSQNMKWLNKLSPSTKRETTDEDCKEDIVSKPASHFKPLPSKKKKIMKF